MLCGLQPAVLRSVAMACVLLWGRSRDLKADSARLLLLTAWALLLANPFWLFDISFQLSFAAVFFLLALWKPLTDLFPETNWAVKVLLSSCIASLGTMPLVTYYFHRLPLLAPLLSLVLIPMTTLIIYLIIAAMLLPVAPIGWLLNTAVSFQQKVIDFAGSLSFATLTDVYPSVLMVALMYGAMIIAVIRLRTRPSTGL